MSTERSVIWRLLLSTAEVRQVAHDLFPSPKELRLYWPDLRNYVRQAKTFDDAAQAVPGAARGLLTYYSALQLAKAELLVRDPESVFNQRIGHGLSFQPEAAKSFESDRLRVIEGVFPRLYKARTGMELTLNNTLRVVDLARSLPDVSAELSHAGGAPQLVTPIEHYLAWDATHHWSLLGVRYPQVLEAAKSALARLGREYRVITHPRAVESRGGTMWFESRNPGRNSQPSDVTYPEVEALFERVIQNVKPLLGLPMYGTAWLSRGLTKSGSSFMPPDLARYAVIFYLSSIVRYKPSRTTPDDPKGAKWVLDAIAEEVDVHQLRAALYGITGQLHRLTSPEGRAMSGFL